MSIIEDQFVIFNGIHAEEYKRVYYDEKRIWNGDIDEKIYEFKLFRHISDNRIRKMVSINYKTIEKIKSDNKHAALMLIGSTIEAILLDFLLRFRSLKGEDPDSVMNEFPENRKTDLVDLINSCIKLGAFEKIFGSFSVVEKYDIRFDSINRDNFFCRSRDYIHPAKMIRDIGVFGKDLNDGIDKGIEAIRTFFDNEYYAEEIKKVAKTVYGYEIQQDEFRIKGKKERYLPGKEITVPANDKTKISFKLKNTGEETWLNEDQATVQYKNNYALLVAPMRIASRSKTLNINHPLYREDCCGWVKHPVSSGEELYLRISMTTKRVEKGIDGSFNFEIYPRQPGIFELIISPLIENVIWLDKDDGIEEEKISLKFNVR